MLIRNADPETDGAACAEIYAPAITDSVASFELQAPNGAAMASRIESTSARYPWLMAYEADQPLGFAYATEHRSRGAYRWAADTTVYVSPTHHRGGVGRALYGALLPLLVRQGLHTACAGITLPNPASVGLHERMGFELVGVYRRIGYKFGAWWDVGWWQVQLGRPDPDPDAVPAEPGPPARLP